MKCINCNQEIDDGSRLCRYCGTAQPFNQEVYIISDSAKQESNQGQQQTPAEDVTVPLPGANQGQQQPQSEDSTKLLPVAQGQQLPEITYPTVGIDKMDMTKKPKKKGTSGLNIALISLAIVLGLALVGGAIWYFFFYNKVKRLDADMELVEFNRKGGEEKVTIDTDAKKFEVTDSPDWLDVDIEDDQIVITCEELNGDKNRKGTIEVTAGNKTIDIAVKQSAAASHIGVERSTLYADDSGGITNIDIETDGNVETFDFDINVNWIRITNKTESSITLEISQNYSSETRRGQVTITSGKAETTISVEQQGVCSYCNGTGSVTCSECDGIGRTYDYQWDDFLDCSNCGGTGKMACPQCGG